MRTGTILAVGLLVVLVSIAGVGLMLGSSSGDQGQSGEPEPTETDRQTAPEPVETSVAPETATETPRPPSPAGDQTESISVNQSQLVTAIEVELNSDRSFTDTYQTDSRTATRLASMANAHSRNMADQQFLSHNVGDGNSRDRYERNDLFGQCEFKKDSYVLDASDNQLEVIGRVSIDAYASGGSASLEERLADALVSDWETTPRYEERISYENAGTIGVGVAVSSDDEVYATVNIC